MGYNNNFEYGEKVLFPNFATGFITTVGYAYLFAMIACKPFGWFARKFILPKQGEGMPLADLEKGYLTIYGEGTGVKGNKVNSVMHFPKDPGYLETARMLCESGLVFVFDNDQVKVGGGMWNTAQFGKPLLKRLEKEGTQFRFYNP